MTAKLRMADRFGRIKALATIATVPAATLLLGGTAAGPDRQVYVLSNVYVAAYPDDSACPKLSLSAEQIFLQSLPAADRERLADPANERESEKRMKETYGFKGGPTGKKPGPSGAAPDYTRAELDGYRKSFKIPPGKGKPAYLGLSFQYNLCTDPDDFPQFAVGNEPYLGRTTFGINLDGEVGKDDFLSPEGEPGVDNALIRATGCNRTTRDYGDPKIADNVITSMASPPIMEISGVDDAANDSDVTVRFYASANALELDSGGKPLAFATFDIDSDPRFQSETKGRIENGVLTTEPFDLRFRMREQIIDSVREIKGARLRFQYAVGGPISGGIYGYHTVDSLIDPYAQSGTVGINLMSCPAAIASIRSHADGYPDPRTRRNTAISAALNFKGVPAFTAWPRGAGSAADKGI